VLLHMMAGSKEDAETVTAFFRGHEAARPERSGAPGIIKAIEICFPRAARQRCLAHRMRNLAVKLPQDVWPEFKVRAQAAYQAPSRAIARELAAGIAAEYDRKYDSAVACFMDDFEACIAHLRFPVTHRRTIRTTDEIDKSFLLRDLLFCRSTGDRVAKSRARGCQPDRAAVIVAPHWRHPCAASRDHAAAIG
jgi:putative transposase